MKIKIGNKIIDTNFEPVIVYLTDQDKTIISNMNDKTKFIVTPSNNQFELSESDKRTWIDEPMFQEKMCFNTGECTIHFSLEPTKDNLAFIGFIPSFNLPFSAVSEKGAEKTVSKLITAMVQKKNTDVEKEKYLLSNGFVYCSKQGCFISKHNTNKHFSNFNLNNTQPQL